MTRMGIRISTIAASLLVLSALPAAAVTAETLTFGGALSYRARIALPPGAVAVVELREGTDAWGTLVTEQRTELKGRQVPIPFTLEVDRARLQAGKAYLLRGYVMAGGRTRWSTSAVRVDPAAPGLTVGALDMTPAAASSLAAAGNEPGWNVDVGTTIVLIADYGQLRVSMPARAPERVDGGVRYSGSADGHPLSIVVLDRACTDSMSGLERPKTVTVTLDDRKLSGCGGPPVEPGLARRP